LADEGKPVWDINNKSIKIVQNAWTRRLSHAWGRHHPCLCACAYL